MQDMNGNEIKTGQVVEIKNAYFKNDNGLYYVDNVPGNPSWCGSDASLMKICKNGKISKSGHICFWPITAFVNSREETAKAKDWNRANATIEIVDGVCTDYIRDVFLTKAEEADANAEHLGWNFGEDSDVAKLYKRCSDFYKEVAAGL